MRITLFLFLLFIASCAVNAQIIQINEKDEYTIELLEKVNAFLPSIVDQSDSVKYISSRNTIIKQYIELRYIYETRDKDIASMEANQTLDSASRNKNIELIILQAENKVYILHAEFIGRLSIDLTLEQIEKVKEAMTGNAFTSTYDSYLMQNPGMKETLKKYTYACLYAARELTMDKRKTEEHDTIFNMYKRMIDTCLAQDTIYPVPDDDPEYTTVLIARVDGYLPNVIEESDPRYEHIRQLVINEYKDLRRIHDKRDDDIAAESKKNSVDFKTKSLNTDLIYYRAEQEVYHLHDEYLGRLNAELTLEEVDGIKSWMSYDVFNITYNAYLELNPDMTEVQKQFAYGCLFGARELAMDKGSSDEKHATFNIYKGIINNYLNGLYNPNTHLDITFDTSQNAVLAKKIINNESDKLNVYIYPNPLSNLGTIEIYHEAEIKGIILYNISGQKVMNISEAIIESGTHLINFDASGLIKGIYFMCVETGNKQTIIKIVK